VKGIELTREDDPDPEKEEENANAIHLGEKTVGIMGKRRPPVASYRREDSRKGFRIFFTSIFGKFRAQIAFIANLSQVFSIWICKVDSRF